MRLPIAYTPINCLLIVMMILSPWIGKKAKEHLQSNHETRQIEKIKKSFVASKSKKKKKPRRVKKKVKQAEPSKSLLAKAQEQIIEELKATEKAKEEPKEKQFLLGESRVIELSSRSNESIKQSKKLAFSQVEKPLSTPKTKKHYMRKIRDHAINKDYMSAESVFLEMLESQDISLSPLDSLEKLDQFKNKFEKLSNSLAKN
ncbi:MAG: hypothetical protein KC646_13715 [Candidatus Cloacimonetes bacterium]|nr:hypothetical protein [Candidatus Cloacimonadota bacterium]